MTDATILRRLEALETKMQSFERRLDMRAGKETTYDPPTSDEGYTPAATEGTIPRGKYRGSLHDDVVRADPHHVCWLFANGHAAGLGYTDEHRVQAEANSKTTADPFNRRRAG